MTRLGQMLTDEGMELKETDSIKKLMKNMNLTIDPVSYTHLTLPTIA